MAKGCSWQWNRSFLSFLERTNHKLEMGIKHEKSLLVQSCKKRKGQFIAENRAFHLLLHLRSSHHHAALSNIKGRICTYLLILTKTPMQGQPSDLPCSVSVFVWTRLCNHWRVDVCIRAPCVRYAWFIALRTSDFPVLLRSLRHFNGRLQYARKTWSSDQHQSTSIIAVSFMWLDILVTTKLDPQRYRI